VGVEQLVGARRRKADAHEHAQLPGVALGQTATDPRDVAAVLAAGGGLGGHVRSDRLFGGRGRGGLA
jgi:hypothetical protein